MIWQKPTFLRVVAVVVLGLTGSALFVQSGAFGQQPAAQDPAQSNQPGSGTTGSGPGQGRGQGRGRGMRGGFGDGRGVFGTVTEIASDHYTVKTDNGDLYTVFYSVNTRILRQMPGGGGRRQGTDANAAEGGDAGGNRQQPQTIKATDIKQGDLITAGGEVDAEKKTVGAVLILQLDPERAKQARALQAQFGKTWLAGRITAVQDTKITIEGALDHASHVILVDENTSFRRRRDSITLADIKAGDQLRAEGAVKDGIFVATTVNAIEPREPGQGGLRPGGGPGAGAPPQDPQQ